MEFKEAISKTLPVEMICRGGVRKWDFSFTPGERESHRGKGILVAKEAST